MLNAIEISSESGLVRISFSFVFDFFVLFYSLSILLEDWQNVGLGVFDVHEIYTIKHSHIYIFSLTFMLFCD